MDTALELKIGIDKGLSISRSEALQLLEQSELVKKLTRDWRDDPLFYVWRLIALSEIPYAQHLEYTCMLIDRIFEKLATPFGFSLSGDKKYFLPCYNAMLVSAMCRLGHNPNNNRGQTTVYGTNSQNQVENRGLSPIKPENRGLSPIKPSPIKPSPIKPSPIKPSPIKPVPY